MPYNIIRKILFSLTPETSHSLALKSLKLSAYIGLSKYLIKSPVYPCQVMGLQFKNPIGLAAGLDKNGDYIDALAALGFGFIEIGTITPKPQQGNPLPRLFRLPERQALINRMGFNNKGVDYAVRRLAKTRFRGILGINIGKNRDTPNDNAVDDYVYALRKLWQYASYFTINISSPNTPGLRDLQESKSLEQLLSALKQEQKHILDHHQKYIPLAVKISPDLGSEQIKKISSVLLALQMDAVIATNTSAEREGVLDSIHAKEAGGLSGKPIAAQSTRVIQQLQAGLQGKLAIIASGGIVDRASAQEKMKAGANLLQVYTGFIYQGPRIITSLAQALVNPRI